MDSNIYFDFDDESDDSLQEASDGKILGENSTEDLCLSTKNELLAQFLQDFAKSSEKEEQKILFKEISHLFQCSVSPLLQTKSTKEIGEGSSMKLEDGELESCTCFREKATQFPCSSVELPIPEIGTSHIIRNMVEFRPPFQDSLKIVQIIWKHLEVMTNFAKGTYAFIHEHGIGVGVPNIPPVLYLHIKSDFDDGMVSIIF